MVVWTRPPSLEAAAGGGGPAMGEVEAAREVSGPPDAPAALPRPLTARLLLDRLRRELRRDGWTAEHRYGAHAPMLRVYSAAAPCVGDSITVVGGAGRWWYRSSAGQLLALCSEVGVAVSRISMLLRPWVAAASSSGGDARQRRSEHGNDLGPLNDVAGMAARVLSVLSEGGRDGGRGD